MPLAAASASGGLASAASKVDGGQGFTKTATMPQAAASFAT